MIGSTLQIIGAITIVIILFVIGFSVFNMELYRQLRNSGSVKKEIPIFTGLIDISSRNSGVEINTTDPSQKNFKNLPDSINQESGIEYTYNFWLYIDYNKKDQLFDKAYTYSDASGIQADSGLLTLKQMNINGKNSLVPDYTSIPNKKPVVLLLHGNKKPAVYQSICDNNLKVDILVKSPLIKLEQQGDALTVEINTIKSPESIHEASLNTCDGNNPDWNTTNNYKIGVKGLSSRQELQSKWFMVTVVLQSTYPSDPFPIRNKVKCSIYINGVLESFQYLNGRFLNQSLKSTSSGLTLDNIENALKQPTMRANQGNLYICPVINYNATSINPANESLQTNKIQLTQQIPSNVSQSFLMADLTYYNYAIEANIISNKFKGGINKYYSMDIDSYNAPGSIDPNAFMKSKSSTNGNPILDVIGTPSS